MDENTRDKTGTATTAMAAVEDTTGDESEFACLEEAARVLIRMKSTLAALRARAKEKPP